MGVKIVSTGSCVQSHRVLAVNKFFLCNREEDIPLIACTTIFHNLNRMLSKFNAPKVSLLSYKISAFDGWTSAILCPFQPIFQLYQDYGRVIMNVTPLQIKRFPPPTPNASLAGQRLTY